MFQFLKPLNIRLTLAAMLVAVMALSACILTEEPPSSRNTSDAQKDANSEDIVDHDAADIDDALACTPGGDECKSIEKSNQTSTCSDRSRTCIIRCKVGFGDCNANLSDGCETSLSDPDSCGACGKVCSPDDAHFARTCEMDREGLFKCGVDPTVCEDGFELESSDAVLKCVSATGE